MTLRHFDIGPHGIHGDGPFVAITLAGFIGSLDEALAFEARLVRLGCSARGRWLVVERWKLRRDRDGLDDCSAAEAAQAMLAHSFDPPTGKPWPIPYDAARTLARSDRLRRAFPPDSDSCCSACGAHDESHQGTGGNPCHRLWPDEEFPSGTGGHFATL